MLNIDMAMYHNFTPDANGRTAGKFCPQFENTTQFDCHAHDPSFLPLSRNAQNIWNYAKNQTLYFWDVIHAFIEMTSIPAENDPGIYQGIAPAWECVQETNMVTGNTFYTLKCLGDLFLQGCIGFSQPQCPPPSNNQPQQPAPAPTGQPTSGN